MKNHRSIKIIITLYVFFLITAGISGSDEKTDPLIRETFTKNSCGYLIYISKKDFIMQIFKKDLSVAESYKIGYGLNPDKKAKLCAGDNRTPEGIYKITEILSLDADRNSIAYKKLRDMNSVYFRAKDGHYKFGKRDADLGYNAYGPRFYRIDYPNNKDNLRYNEALKNGMIPKNRGKILSIGAGIAIHGNNDEESIGRLASSGCIRMHNKDIVLLDKYIEIGLPVIISAD